MKGLVCLKANIGWMVLPEVYQVGELVQLVSYALWSKEGEREGGREGRQAGRQAFVEHFCLMCLSSPRCVRESLSEHV